MNPEENKRILALSYIVADLKAENMELVEHVKKLVDEYNEVAHQLNGKEKRMNEGPSAQTLDEMQQMREHCDNLERENRKLKRFAKAMRAFVKYKIIYMRKGTSCEYKQGNPPVCSTACLECSSCLGVIEDHGVICEKRLKEVNVSLLSGVGEVSLAESSAVFPNDE